MRTLRTAALLLALFTALLGLVYPAAVTGAARLLFPWRAGGSLLFRDGRPVGSALIGQEFTDPGLFWGRPSATAGRPYDAAASAGSNLGPANPALLAAVRTRVEVLRAADPGRAGPVPGDLVTTSGSGLDPHVSPAAAAFQAARVARARGLDPEAVRRLVAAHVEGAPGMFGERRVNVLRLNLALLDLAKPPPK